LNALEEYTNETFFDINQYLYNGHAEGTDYHSAKYIESLVDKLDSAFEETEAPFKYTTYTGLSKRYNPESFQVGKDYIFKGYVSSSLDHNVAAGSFAGYKKDAKSKTGGKNGVVLELEIPKGAKSIYIPNKHSAQYDDEHETLLPRGTKIRVVSGPHMVPAKAVVDPSYTNAHDINPGAEEDTNLVVFKCKVVKEDT
jgi:hypothetical protein